jgi:hypothetical protein
VRISYDTTAKPTGYTMWLSARETYDWAHKRLAWPCSNLSDHRCVVGVDSNGLCDFTLGGRGDETVDGDELAACVADHLPKQLRHLWPCWEG